MDHHSKLNCPKNFPENVFNFRGADSGFNQGLAKALQVKLQVKKSRNRLFLENYHLTRSEPNCFQRLENASCHAVHPYSPGFLNQYCLLKAD